MDPKSLSAVNQLSNDELIERVKNLAEREREATASLIAHLAELDERRLYLAEGYSSLFTYCTQVLRLSEHAAYRRIEAARIIRKLPVILEMFEQGSVNLRRCTEQGFLEYHHVTPYASGGPPTVENIQLRCRAHNGYEAELDFGPRNSASVREERTSYLSPDRTAATSVRTEEPAVTRSGPSSESSWLSQMGG